MQNEKEGFSFESLADPRVKLENILNKPLTPETVDVYASSALEEIIQLIQTTITQYNHQPTHSFNSVNEQEDAAFRYYGLDDIEKILDYVADKQDELREIDFLIENSPNTSQVILPSDEFNKPRKLDGSIESRPRGHVPRLKTILFVLKNEYGVDISNPDEVTILRGKVDRTMMRQESYYALRVDSLERTVLVCDEGGNASYVLDSAEIEALNISSEDLLNLTKSELNDFIIQHPQIGQRLQYGKAFVSKIIQLINNPQLSVGENYRAKQSEERSYLKPDDTTGYLSVHSMTPIMGVNFRTLRKVVDVLSEELSEVIVSEHSRGTTFKYSPNNQQIIRKYLEDNGYYAEQAPEHVLPVKRIAEKYNVNNSSVLKAIGIIGNDIGPVGTYRFGDVIGEGYEVEQQERILLELEKMELFLEKAPDDIYSMYQSASMLDVAPPTLKKIVAKIDNFGVIERYRFGSQGKIADGYTLSQIELMQSTLKEMGYYTEAPEGYLPLTAMAKKLNMDNRQLWFLVKSAKSALGDVLRCRYGGRATSCYSPEQQKMLEELK